MQRKIAMALTASLLATSILPSTLFAQNSTMKKIGYTTNEWVESQTIDQSAEQTNSLTEEELAQIKADAEKLNALTDVDEMRSILDEYFKDRFLGCVYNAQKVGVLKKYIISEKAKEKFIDYEAAKRERDELYMQGKGPVLVVRLRKDTPLEEYKKILEAYELSGRRFLMELNNVLWDSIEVRLDQSIKNACKILENIKWVVSVKPDSIETAAESSTPRASEPSKPSVPSVSDDSPGEKSSEPLKGETSDPFATSLEEELTQIKADAEKLNALTDVDEMRSILDEYFKDEYYKKGCVYNPQKVAELKKYITSEKAKEKFADYEEAKYERDHAEENNYFPRQLQVWIKKGMPTDEFEKAKDMYGLVVYSGPKDFSSRTYTLTVLVRLDQTVEKVGKILEELDVVGRTEPVGINRAPEISQPSKPSETSDPSAFTPSATSEPSKERPSEELGAPSKVSDPSASTPSATSEPSKETSSEVPSEPLMSLLTEEELVQIKADAEKLNALTDVDEMRSILDEYFKDEYYKKGCVYNPQKVAELKKYITSEKAKEKFADYEEAKYERDHAEENNYFPRQLQVWIKKGMSTDEFEKAKDMYGLVVYSGPKDFSSRTYTLTVLVRLDQTVEKMGKILEELDVVGRTEPVGINRAPEISQPSEPSETSDPSASTPSATSEASKEVPSEEPGTPSKVSEPPVSTPSATSEPSKERPSEESSEPSKASEPSISSEPSVLEKVKSVTAYKISKTQAKVAWKKVKNADGYRVFFRDEKTKKYSSKSLNAETTAYMLQKLQADKTYRVWVVAYRTVGTKKIYSEGYTTRNLNMKKQPIKSDLKVVEKFTLSKGKSKKLKVVLAKGKDASYIAGMIYKVKDKKICTVKNGTVTAKKIGSTKVMTTVRLKNGQKKSFQTIVKVVKKQQQ